MGQCEPRWRLGCRDLSAITTAALHTAQIRRWCSHNSHQQGRSEKRLIEVRSRANEHVLLNEKDIGK